MRPIIWPYKLGSEGARNLAHELGTKCVRSNGTYIPRSNHLIINWGNSNPANWMIRGGAAQQLRRINFLNLPSAVEIGHNKLLTFQRFREENVNCPEWTTDMRQASGWREAGDVVIARMSLTSSEGRGIHICERGGEGITGGAPLYVKYKKKAKEFRVHVFKDQVLDVQQKRKRNGEEVDYRIRSHRNGWIFARQNVTEPTEIRDLAIRAIRSCRLDFGAVDIVWNKAENRCYALEVNTAPGIEGESINLYATAIRELL